MRFIVSKFFFLFCFCILISCSNQKPKNPFNLYGNSQRTSSYEKLGRFWMGISTLENAKTTDEKGFDTFPLALSDNKFVSSTKNGYILLYQHTSLLWEFKLDTNEFLVSDFAASPNEDLFFITNKNYLYSISSNGVLKWKVPIFDSASYFSTLLTTNSSIYFSSSKKNLKSYDFNGKLKWTLELPLEATSAFAEFNNDNLVINLTNNEVGKTDTIIFVSSDGKIRWKKFFSFVRLLRSPIVWKDEIFAFGYSESQGSYIGFLYCLDSTGNVLWTKEFGLVPRYLSVSDDGFLYLCLYNTGLGETLSKIYKIDNQGKIVTQQNIGAIFYTPFFISQQILCAVGYTRGNPSLIFLDSDLNLWKILDLTRFPNVLNIPAFLTDCSLIFVSSVSNHFVRIDENPVIKLLPW